MIWWTCYFYLDAKRLIGRKFDDAEVQADMKHWPFEVKNEGTRPKVEVEYKGEKKRFFPEEVSNILFLYRVLAKGEVLIIYWNSHDHE